jgi:hypothetical protein
VPAEDSSIVLPLPLNIYVDGKRRKRLVLEATEIPEAQSVSLEYDSTSCGPALRSDGKHYKGGAYHFWRSVVDIASPGLYRVNRVSIEYRDGSQTSVPVSGNVVIEIEAVPLPVTPLSVFIAR